jgi:hypothetical protein
MFKVKMILAVILIAVSAITAAVWNGTADISWYNGTDTEFTIATAEQLAGLASLVNDGTDDFEGKTITLKNNLYLDNKNWTPIGGNSGFSGVFDGNNYSIFDLFVPS